MTWVRTDDGGARGDRQAGTVLVGSPLGSLQQAFRLASEPTLTSLQGRFQATIAGPSWVRLPALLVVHVTGMPGWWGKEFAVDERGPARREHAHDFAFRHTCLAVRDQEVYDVVELLAEAI